MEKLINLLPEIVTLLSLVVGVIINFTVSKNSNVQKTLSNLALLIPYWVIDAEKKGFVSGEAKKNYVVELSVAYLSSHLKKDVDVIVGKYDSTIDCLIEKTLSTPQKKEVD